MSISLLTFYLSPPSLSSRVPCSRFLWEDRRSASPPSLHADTSTHSQVQERGRGAHGTPAYRSEGQQRAGEGSALDFCLEVMGAHGSADPCRGGCEQVLPPPWQVPSHATASQPPAVLPTARRGQEPGPVWMDGGCIVTSIWDEIFFMAAQGKMASYIPCMLLESTFE